jgi:pSer/pThr/pTyr-binding forkhead associated (FHA) protein
MVLERTSDTPRWLTRRITDMPGSMLAWSAAAGGAGGILGWALGEASGWASAPGDNLYLGVFLYFMVVSAAIGAVLGALPGMLNRSRDQIVRGAIIGAVIAGVGGGLGGLPAQWAFTTLGSGLLGRAVGWAIVGAFIGLCPGAATRDGRRALRGLAGGAVGGFVGGLLFDLIGAFSAAGSGTPSRFAADIAVGMCIGLMVALVEIVLKNAWLTVLSGRREGAQFILSKETTTIGRDDRDDVLLWGDEQMAIRHARITRTRRGYVLQSVQPAAPTLVNRRPVGAEAPLEDGDEVVLGATRMIFHTHGTAAPHVGTSSAAAGGALAGRITPAPQPGASSSDGRQTPPPTARRLLDAGYDAAPPAVPAASGFRLVPLDGGRTYALPRRGLLAVGRGPDNDLVIDDDSVSTRHAELRWEDGAWVVYDHASTNGTLVSFTGAPAEERAIARNALRHGSIVRFGRAAYRLEQE